MVLKTSLILFIKNVVSHHFFYVELKCDLDRVSWDSRVYIHVCMSVSVCVCVWVRRSRVVNNVRFWADRDTALYIHGSRLSVSMTLGSSCLSVILYTSPHLYRFTLYPSAEHSSPALIQLGFIKPDHWRIRVMRFLLCEEHWISVCIYVRIEKIIHVDTVGMCACVCVCLALGSSLQLSM